MHGRNYKKLALVILNEIFCVPKSLLWYNTQYNDLTCQYRYVNVCMGPVVMK